MNLPQALELARGQELDLVEISPTATPPVCKILDYGKYKYEQTKKERKAKKGQKIGLLKEVRFRPKIEEHDFNTKSRQTIEFLQKGYKVKLTIRFRGRELSHTDIGRNVLNKLIEKIDEFGAVDFNPKFEGRTIVTVVSPKKNK